MPKFEYKSRLKGKTIEKETTAQTRALLLEDLKNAGNEVIYIREVKERKWSLENINNLFVRVKLRDLVVFSRNLSAMIDAGLPLSRSFSILKRQTDNAKMQKVLDTCIEAIEEGRSLSSAMEQYPKVFSDLFVAMVQAGEQTGSLSNSLTVLGNQLEKSYNLRKKIRGAMIYPSIVISAMFVIAIFMFIYVVPTLTQTFEDMNAELPTSTQLIIFVSDLLAQNTIISLSVISAVIIGAIVFFRTQYGKVTLDFSLLYVPVVKKLVRESNAAYMSRSLSSLLASGVNVVEALKITYDVVPNVYFKEVVKEAGERVEKGEPLHGAFSEKENLYPVLVSEMMEVGEETGQVSSMLERLASFYEDEVEVATKDMSQIVEPVLMLVIASAVGFFAVSMITPIYSLSSSI